MSGQPEKSSFFLFPVVIILLNGFKKNLKLIAKYEGSWERICALELLKELKHLKHTTSDTRKSDDLKWAAGVVVVEATPRKDCM